MAPATTSAPSLLSQSSQSAKKQQSISSFFKKPAPGAPPLKSPKGLASSHNSHSAPLEDRSSVREESPGSKQPVTGDYGSNDEDDILPSAKRQKISFHEFASQAPSEKSSRRPSAPATRAVENERAQNGSSPTSVARGPKPKVSDRTSKYLFSSPAESDPADEDEDSRRGRERMHQKFMNKLGEPDSMAKLGRRNNVISEEVPDGEDMDGVEEEDEPEVAKPARGRKGTAAKKSGSKLTPMEKQVLDIKRGHMDTLLVVEVGYKYRFFGEDARIAAKELHIFCIPGKYRYDEHPSEAHIDRFASASFPTHRLHVHVKRLLQAGHKIGVVRQLETAALKAVGDNRNTPFVRQLTNLYTKGTYIDDLEGLEGPSSATAGAPTTGHLLCLSEINAKGWGTDETVRIGIIAVQPTTGEIIYDDFEDGFMRTELETRLLHIAPCEFLVVGDLSKTTEKLVAHLSGSKTNVFGDRARVERVEKPKIMAAQAYSHISTFYAGKVNSNEGSEDSSALLDKVHRLSEQVTICLSAMITHLSDYGLEHVFDLTKYFQSFSARSHMLLNANTLTSLEVYQNQTDHTEYGSLLWALDRTKTRFGQRLLRKWVGRPLLDQAQLNERVSAVEELMDSNHTVAAEKLSRLLRQIKGDLEKSLIRIYYKKCSRPELVSVLQMLQTIANEYAHVQTPEDSGFETALLGQAIASLPKIADDVVSYLDRINLSAAKEDDKYDFFREKYETETITDHKVGIVSIEYDLTEHKNAIATILKKKKVDYVPVAGIEYLIEVDNAQIKNVPASWAKISGTKKVSRFHTPEVIKFVREREQHKEALAKACDAAFSDLLQEIGSRYQAFRDCVQSLATIDCLLSLAEVAGNLGYCKPEFTTEGTCIQLEGGRHPMVENLLVDPYVPNDVDLGSGATRALLITGPNMGGKSSYVRSVALISIMAQIGSYVPATSAKLSLLDAVFTRMGAFDNMMKGESTFMVELSETADILKQATPRSLVILDELGRGTSTHDGVAIAQAVLDYIMRQSRSMVLFITHYQTLSRLSLEWPGGELKNVHMRFRERQSLNGESEITFLYEVGEGMAHRSYGLNVARLAGLPRIVLDKAAVKSKDMESEERKRKLTYLGHLMPQSLESSDMDSFESLVRGIEQL